MSCIQQPSTVLPLSPSPPRRHRFLESHRHARPWFQMQPHRAGHEAVAIVTGGRPSRGHPPSAQSESPVAPWRSGNLGCYLSTPGLWLSRQAPMCPSLLRRARLLTLEEKVLDPASPGSGLMALTWVSLPALPQPGSPAQPSFEAQLAPPPACRVRLGEMPSPPRGWGWGLDGVRPGVRLPASCLSCALCRGGTGLGPKAGIPGAGTDPFSSVPNSFLSGTIWSKVWPRKSRPIPASLSALCQGFSHCEQHPPQTRPLAAGSRLPSGGRWPSDWGSGSQCRAEDPQ